MSAESRTAPPRSGRVLLLVLVLLGTVLPGVARAENYVLPDEQYAAASATPRSPDVRPHGFTSTANQAVAAADRTAAVREARATYTGLHGVPNVVGDSWQVNYTDGKAVRVEVDLTTAARVDKVWKGIEAREDLTRGRMTGRLASPLVWVPFTLLFLLPFLDFRRRRRLLHLDLVALLGLGLSLALAERTHVTAAVLAVYPPLLYLLLRALMLGARRGRSAGRAVPWMPTALLAVGLVALVGARVTLSLDSHRLFDMGAASVQGADIIAHGDDLYTDNDGHGDAYGPFNYIAYQPFERIFPFADDGGLRAARAASITFDLLTILGLFVLGSQMRAGPEGRRLGLALGWAWSAYPITLYNLMANTNDGLIAMLLVWSLVAFSRPGLRGAILGLAVAAKFFPAALIGALWRGRDTRPRREMLLTAAACSGVFALAVFLYLPDGGLKEVWNCTLGYQLSRSPDLSLWGLYGLRPLQLALEGGALLLAAAIGFWPTGRRTPAQVAGLAAAVTIALQLGSGHWFYFYAVWFVPLILAATLGACEERENVAGTPKTQVPADVLIAA